MEEQRRQRHTALGFVIGLMVGGLIDLYTGDIGIATVLGMVLGSVIGYAGLQRIHWMEYPPGALLRVFAAEGLFLVVLFGTYVVLNRGGPDWLRQVLPFAPLLPGVLLIGSIGIALSGLDEFQRRIQVEAIAIGFALTALFSLTYGLLGMTGAAQPSWMLVPVVMTFSWLAGKIWTRWKYR